MTLLLDFVHLFCALCLCVPLYVFLCVWILFCWDVCMYVLSVLEPQEAVAGGCEAEVHITFLAPDFWSAVTSWKLTSPFLVSHDHPVGCGIKAHIWDWDGCSRSSFLLPLILSSNCGTGTSSLAVDSSMLLVIFQLLFNSSHIQLWGKVLSVLTKSAWLLLIFVFSLFERSRFGRKRVICTAKPEPHKKTIPGAHKRLSKYTFSYV